MPAYAIVNVEPTDLDLFAEYRALAPASIARYGGRYLVRGGELEVLEGDWQPSRLVVVEFPTYDELKRWYHSEDYQPLKEMRLASANSEFVIVDGLE